MNTITNRRDGSFSPEQLRGRLNDLAGNGRWFLQRWRLREELRHACSGALLALFVLPLLLLLVRFTLNLFGRTSAPVSGWLILGLAILGPALYVLGRLVQVYYRYHPRRQNALALYDEELKTRDRLVTADEFLIDTAMTADDRSRGFKEAAVADADRYAQSALAAMLSPLSLPRWRVSPVSWLGVPATALVVALLLFGVDGSSLAVRANEKLLQAALDASVSPAVTPEERAAARRQAQRLQQQLKEQQLVMLEKQQAAPTRNRQARNEKGAEGQSNSGNSAMAQSMSTSSDAAGEPSSQKNASKPKKPEEEKPEETDSKDPKKKPKKKQEQKTTKMAVSAISGEGKMSMSNSSLTEFDIPEEEDRAGAGTKQAGNEEDANDEDEEEKSNALAKPSLNDRKPAVSRKINLKPPGGYPDPNRQNGRSGPGKQKKTRGVPSMILGIPLPDRVQGMPNPGRSKVTQEDAKPKAETYLELEARMRLARADEAGQVAHPRLLPWMRSLVADYFTVIRQKLGSASSAESEDAAIIR